MKLTPVLGALTILAVSSAAAAAKTYDCAVRDLGNLNWVPTHIVIKHNEQTNKVTVIDGMIDHYMGGPIAAKINTQNAKRTTYSWRLEGGKSKIPGQTNIRIVYRATIFPNGKVTVSGKPLGYQNTFRGKGVCKITK